MNQDYFSSRIEWEWLSEPAVFENAELRDPIVYNANKITIQRGLDYSLYAIIEIQEDPKQSPFFDLVNQNSPVTLSFSVNFGIENLVLLGCVCSGNQMHIDMNYQSSAKRTYTLIPKRIEISGPSEKVGWLTDWYLDGIDKIGVFNNFTKRESSRTLIRERSGDQPKKEENRNRKLFSLPSSFSNNSRDYFVITYSHWTILVTKVPQEIGPNWSENIGIEYYPDDEGNIPSTDEREAISELISFFFGKRLILIGSTEFDEKGKCISQISHQKVGYPYPKKFKAASFPPVDLFELWQEGGIGNLIVEFLPKYIKLRSDVNLNEILWNLWQADHDPLSQQIPTLVLGIEHLAKNWYNSQPNTTKAVYLPKQEYEALIAPEMMNLKQKLKSYADGDKILSKINSAYQMSTSDRISRLFAELDLDVGDIEKNIFKSRNKFSHGYTLSTDEEIREAFWLSMACRSLFGRIVLRILGYSGAYVDYSSEERSAKPIEIPLGS